MSQDKLRRQITFEAARLLYERQESGFEQARQRAARTICRNWVRPADYPSHREIRQQVLQFYAAENSAANAELIGEDVPSDCDDERFLVFRGLLLPLQTVLRSRARHPEGDALYHSLQVFELVAEESPYDEELQLAALLHEVGLAIDALDPVPVALAALDGWITPRTAWFIESLSAAKQMRSGTIGLRQRRRLEESPDFDDLCFLAECDRRGRVSGAVVRELDEALDAIRDLSEWATGESSTASV